MDNTNVAQTQTQAELLTLLKPVLFCTSVFSSCCCKHQKVYGTLFSGHFQMFPEASGKIQELKASALYKYLHPKT